MKLRNKKTGEIVSLQGELTYDDKVRLLTHYNTLAELNEEWEDYEEPNEYWRIDCDGEIEDDEYEGTSFDKDCKEIGNYFETKEEAEKAVEKLKAWKRLKDKGFKFDGWNGTEIGSNIFYISEVYYGGCADDMDLLFGGEE